MIDKNPPTRDDLLAEARALRLFWAKKGYRVLTKVLQSDTVRVGRSCRPVWCVKSDMVDGLPKRWRGARKSSQEAAE